MKKITVLFFAVLIGVALRAQPVILNLSSDTNSLTWKGEVVEGRRHGIWKAESSVGIKLEQEYDHGKLQGNFRGYYRDGKIKETGRYENDLKDGPWVNYDLTTSDTLILTSYSKGKKDGPYLRYQSNGKLQYKGTFANDQMEGIWLELPVYNSSYKTTRIKKEYTYKNGKLNGTTIDYHTDKTITTWYKDDVEQRSETVQKDNAPSAAQPELPEVISPSVVDAAQEGDYEVLSYAEPMPQFPGGEDSLQSYYKKNMRYPQAEKEQGKEGTVYIYFEVAKDGSIGNVKTQKGVPGAPGLSKEAERLVRSMPPWNPGKMNGKPVNVGMTVPVRFVLEK